MPSARSSRRHRAPVALHVDDYEGAKRELSSRGIELENEIDSGVCNMGFFSDPDGNSLMIHHRYKKEMVGRALSPGATGSAAGCRP